MNKRKILFFVIIVSIILSGCDRIKEEDPKEEKSMHDVEGIKENQEDKVMERVQRMPLNEKIGQLVIVGLDSYDIDEHAREMVEEYSIGGVIFFKRNIKDSEQVADFINSLQELNSLNLYPLFISVDEEGGRISRLPKEFEKIPTSREIGKKDDEEYSFYVGELLGKRIKSLGFNLDFAPVLDIDSNPKNSVIGDRSFGPNVELVLKHGIQVMKGIRSQGIISCVKHFPGHGDTYIDSHMDLPVVNKGIDELRKFELLPFQKAIDEGADMIMVSHIMFPKIDKNNPASLSEEIITNILRKDLGFNGVVVTDDMTMGAIVNNYDIGEASVKSLKSGSDIILVCHGYENQVKVIQAIKKAIDDGTLSERDIDEKVYRILKLKEKYLL